MGLDRARGLGGASGGVSFSRGNRKHEYDEHETPIFEGAEEWVSTPLSHFGLLGTEFWLLSCLGTGFRHPLTFCPLPPLTRVPLDTIPDL